MKLKQSIKIVLSLVILVLSQVTFVHAQERRIELTLIDGYNGELITNEKIIIEIDEPAMKMKLSTDSVGKVSFNFKTEESIRYHFKFESGRFLKQTRDRYFGRNKQAEIEFFVYPSKKYERQIKKTEKQYLKEYFIAVPAVGCPDPTLNSTVQSIENYIDLNRQSPFNYGDYGYEASYKMAMIIGVDGKPYNIRILESTDGNLNMEALRLIRSLPPWQISNCQKKLKCGQLLEIEFTIDAGKDMIEPN